MNRQSLIATHRKGKWYIYDANTFKNSIVDILGGEYRVGCNIFEILFDLSYRRCGALLVYDQSGCVRERIVNSDRAVLRPESGNAVARILAKSVGAIQMGAPQRAARRKRLFLEMAAIDGAVIFDRTRVYAVGAMIAPHPDVGSHAGARTTACLSAYHWGGKPVKVSADGEISIPFRSVSPDGDGCDATLEFM